MAYGIGSSVNHDQILYAYAIYCYSFYPMKFIHTSDWHLGRTFHNVSLIDDQQLILDRMIQYISDTPDIDAVIIAGDIYDRSVPPTLAIELLNRVVNTLCQQLNTPVILIPGNHDSAVRLGFAASHMMGSGLHILSSIDAIETPVVLESAQGERVEFFGIPYVDPEFIRNHFAVEVKSHDEMYQYLLDRIRACWNPDLPHVLLAHCFVDGAEESESERPLSLGGLDKVNLTRFDGFDYVALGHLHQPQKRGHEAIRYSGSLLKYSFSEHRQKKSISLIEMNTQGFCSVTPVMLKARRDVRILEGELLEIIENAAQDAHCDDYLLVRLTDKHAILDPMEKLRAVYPNVLHIEKPGLLGEITDISGTRQRDRSELDMFCDFYQEIQGEAVNEKQFEALQAVLQQLNQQAEE